MADEHRTADDPKRDRDESRLADLMAKGTGDHARSGRAGPEFYPVRALALRRMAETQPTVERWLAVFRHAFEHDDRVAALRAVEQAEGIDAGDRRVMWARLDLNANLPPAELLALARCYQPTFPEDPLLAMVVERCVQRLAVDPATR